MEVTWLRSWFRGRLDKVPIVIKEGRVAKVVIEADSGFTMVALIPCYDFKKQRRDERKYSQLRFYFNTFFTPKLEEEGRIYTDTKELKNGGKQAN